MDAEAIARRSQVVLDLAPADAVVVSPHLNLYFHGDTCLFLVGGFPIDEHRVDDRAARNSILARCVDMGLATASQIAGPAGVSVRTVHRVVRQRREQGWESFGRKPSRPGRPLAVQDGGLLRRAANLLRGRASLRGVARKLGLNYQTLRNYKAAGRLPGLPAQAPPAAPAPALLPLPLSEDGPTPGPDKQQRNLMDAGAPQGRATHDTEGRALASLGALVERLPRFELPLRAVAGGGLLAALPALLRQGLFSCAGPLRLPKGFYGVRSILLTLAFMLLSGAKNPHRLGFLQPGELGALLGLDRSPCTRTLRRRTKLLAADQGALTAWRENLAQQWVSDSLPAQDATLLLDGHVQTYGGKGRLPKQFVPRQKLKLPGADSCWAAALGGAPLLVLHEDLNTSLSQQIRGMLPQLRELGLLAERAGRPSQGHAPSLTVVFDRGGSSHGLFDELDRLGVAFITWRTGSQEPWPKDEFGPLKYRVPMPLGEREVTARCAERRVPFNDRLELREMRFIEQTRTPPAGRNGTERQARRREGAKAHRHQPALLTNHPSLSRGDVLARLRGRWAQENLFKFLRQNFGLDSLPEYRLEELDPQARVVNPQWRAMDNLAQRLKARLGRKQVRLQRSRLQPGEADRLQREIERLHHALNGTEDCRKRTPRHVLAGELPRELRYQALAKPMRYLMDTLRMLTYRAELDLARQLAPHLSKPETAHEIVRHTLFASEASLVPDHRAGILRVRLMHQSRNCLDEALQPLLAELNKTRTVYPGTNLRLVYEFVSG